jgi:uncharacterized protein YoxC
MSYSTCNIYQKLNRAAMEQNVPGARNLADNNKVVIAIDSQYIKTTFIAIPPLTTIEDQLDRIETGTSNAKKDTPLQTLVTPTEYLKKNVDETKRNRSELMDQNLQFITYSHKSRDDITKLLITSAKAQEGNVAIQQTLERTNNTLDKLFTSVSRFSDKVSSLLNELRELTRAYTQISGKQLDKVIPTTTFMPD